MAVSKEQILATLKTLETKTPVDFGGMMVREDSVAETVARSMAGLSESCDRALLPAGERELVLLSTIAHLMLEMTTLHHRLSSQTEAASRVASGLLQKVSAR